MKRIILISLVLLSVASTFAQKPSLTKAYNFFYDKDFVKAKEAIDLCVQDEKLSAKAQTWLYKGNIYYFLANNEYSEKQKNEAYQIVYPNAPIEAYDAFMKSKEINSNAEAMDMFTAKDALKQLYPFLLVRGSEQLVEKDYAGAKSTLQKAMTSYEMDTPKFPMNGDIYLYYAYALEYLGEKEHLQEFYNKALEDGSTNPYVYVRLIEAYKATNDRANVEKVLHTAKSKAPNEMSVRLAEIDYYYWINDSVKAKSLLQNIPVNSITNPDDLMNLANSFIRDKNYEEAARLLEKANRLSPNNFVVLYNLGVCKYNISEELFNHYNDLAVSKTNDAQAQSFKTQSEQMLAESAQYFEQARILEPNDLSLLNTLRAIYARQQSPKYDEIDAFIKKLE
ncbi:MAG: hypothetical protein MJZ57_04275 [Bacteroidales bacterium]|nr:hypothetical protein [Bacteroidales bacterium]